jgi:hypothetical protein
VDACPVVAHLIDRFSCGIDARGRGIVVRCQNSRLDNPNDAEDLRDLVSLGPKEFWAKQRLDGGAVTGGLRQFREAGD